MTIYTIGFTQKSAQQFFEGLRQTHVARVLDTRLHNVSQLSGFSKRADLEYFLRELCGLDYFHRTDLAPTEQLLKRYRHERDWGDYSTRFLELLRERRVEKLPPELFDRACLLCSEFRPDLCHRRLVAEYLQRHWPQVSIVHL